MSRYNKKLNVGFAACILIAIMVIVTLALARVLGQTMPRIAVVLCVVVAVLSVVGMKIGNKE